MPAGAASNDKFVRDLGSEWADAEIGELPDRFRAIMLEEWFLFPLSGVPDVLGSHGLNTATSTIFPTFHSRNDVAWRGLSDEEARNWRRAEELLVAGFLGDVFTAEAGFLVSKGWPRDLGVDDVRYFPLDFAAAVEMLSRQNSDAKGRPIAGALDEVTQKLAGRRRYFDGDEDAQADACLDALDSALIGKPTGAVSGWPQAAARILGRYLGSDDTMFRAYVRRFPPPTDTIKDLAKKAGQLLPRGGVADKDGLYCSIDGGWIGADEKEAARNGWTCYFNPEHYFGPVQRQA